LTLALLAGDLLWYASYPCLFTGLRQCPLAATYPAPGSHIDSLVTTFFIEFVSRFPASFILLTNPEPVWAILRILASQPAGMLWYAYYPWACRYPERPNRLPSCVRTPTSASSGRMRLTSHRFRIFFRSVDRLTPFAWPESALTSTRSVLGLVSVRRL